MTRRLVVSGLALLLAGCPDPVAQCRSTCNGCCTAQGTCEAGTSKGACGELGALCVTCEIEQICNPTRCTARPPPDAGLDAGNDGGTDGGLLSASYAVAPTTPMFEACATRDFAGAPVPDVFPDLRLLTIRNVGTAPGTPSLVLMGGGAEAFHLDGGVGLLQPDAGAALEVRFSPPDAGVWVAQLLVGNAVSTLAGTVLPNPPTPLLQPAVVTNDGSFSDCNRMGACTQAFAPTLFGDATAREVQLTNLGCPSLKVTGVEIIPAGTAFTLETPAIPPAADRPIVLTVTGNQQATKLKIRFAPTDDGSGNPARTATLRLLTNDRTVKDAAGTLGGYDIALTGNGLKPALTAVPVACNYSDPLDLCGNAPKQMNTAHFVLSNTTAGPVLINEAVFQSNASAAASAGGRFTLPTALAGSVIGPLGTMAFDVTYSAQPLFVQDRLVVAASVPGADAGTMGRTTLSLSGGNAPCLSTVPGVLDFEGPSAATTTKIVTVRNALGCGALTLNSLTIDPSPYFSLFPPILQPGMTIQPGQNVDATVKYTKPASGNPAGVLRIQSNDPAYLGPQGLMVPLYGATPLDPAPVAAIKACNPNDTACAAPFTTVSLATLPNGPNGTKLVTIDGTGSYDPPGMSTPATSFKFALVGVPGSAAQAAITGTVASATPRATLTADATGLYRVALVVKDAGGQTGSAVLNLTLTP